MEGGERGQAGKGIQWDPRGPVKAAGIEGTHMKRWPTEERWEPGWARCGSRRRARPRVQSGSHRRQGWGKQGKGKRQGNGRGQGGLGTAG